MDISSSNSRRDMYERSPAGELLGVGLVSFVMLGAISTEHSYLRAPIVARTSMVFLVLGALCAVALLVRRLKIGIRRNPGESGLLTTGKYLLALLLASATFAGISVLVGEVGLLLAVKYGPSRPVEFQSQVMRIFPIRKSCKRMIQFGNVPLARDADFCAAQRPLDQLKPGDRIIVTERVGPLGGTIVSVKADPQVAEQRQRQYRAAADFCSKQGKRFEPGSDISQPAVTTRTDLSGGFRFRCE